MATALPTFADLTLPDQAPATARAVLNGYMRSMAKSLVALPASRLDEPARAAFAQLLPIAQRLLREDPRRLVPVLRQPTHAALLTVAHRELAPEGDLARGSKLVHELVLLTLLELAGHGGLPDGGVVIARRGTAWPAFPSLSGRFVLRVGESVERVEFLPGALVLHQGASSFRVPLPGPTLAEGVPATLEHPYVEIADGIVLALADNNPLQMYEAHPDKQGNAIDLGGHPAEEWAEVLRDCLKLVDRYLPGLGQEIRLVVRQVVPVGWHDQKHLSASYQESVGTIYMTLHPNRMTMTEALIHEFQHNKINAAFHLDPMLHNAFWPLYTSPVRPDPRPLHGIVLAVHAFQPVAKLYEAMAADKHEWAQSPSWHKRFRDVLRMIHAGAETVLTNAQPTTPGQELFDEMRKLDAHFVAYEAAHWTEQATQPAPHLPE